jgi:hypothetical protein
MTVARRAQNTDRWSNVIPERLEEAVKAFDFAGSDAFVPLAELSHATEFDGIAVDSHVIVVNGKRWFAPATVYATLVYRDKVDDPDPARSAASFPATINFEVTDGAVTITGIEVDTSSFYE